jgi:hypothetical protein
MKAVQLGVRKLLDRPSQYFVTEPIGHRTKISTAAAFRLFAYLPIIDWVIVELEAQFSDNSSTAI